ncbi:uncharacterized protein LOC127792950 isoform X2 [Diospyros lotus]|uniref:uncharacterized protein LOC127792950 isoform X2 n=1 Tax=Diospyros lotus TaxID=55363 RepID=UPI0022541F67|nr:uncharacterized protein LOC127792950 isoform X2 [Diospyros lotus]
MSSCSSCGSENSFDVEGLFQIRTRCEELRKEKDTLRDSQSQSFELIRRLEVHVKTLSEARTDDEKYIQELERESKNCSQEIDYLQDQLNARDIEVHALGEHVRRLELKLADMESLEEKIGRLREELNWSESERLILMQELESKEVDVQNSASYIQKLEESISSISLEYQCELESMKLDLMALEHSNFEAKVFQEEATQEKARMNKLIQDFELQIQDAQNVIKHLHKENEDLRVKLESSEMNAKVFCQKIEQQFKSFPENTGRPQVNNQSFSPGQGKDIRLAVVGANDADFRDKMDKMSYQIFEYVLQVEQLKEELRAEKLKAKDEAEDLAQEMAELRYQMTGLLEEERKHRAYVEQISLQRIAKLEAQIQKEGEKTSSSARLIQGA